jgi:hypothetical protein
VADEVLSTRINGKWAAEEHLGHLVDLDVLDHARLREFLNRVATLSPADMRNQATEDAGHQDTPIGEILLRMRTGRRALVFKLEQLTEEEVAITAVHPRLRVRMRLLAGPGLSPSMMITIWRTHEEPYESSLINQKE